jgi:hypothetical protein
VRWVVGLLAGVVSLAGVASPAQAQWLPPWRVLEDIHNPPLGSRQIKRYALMLNLSPEQKAAADELLSGYEREFRALASRMQEVQKSIEEEYDNDDEIDVWREVWPKVIKGYTKKSETLNKTLLDDLKVLLDNSQLATWERVERQHRRETALRSGTRAGEQVDLIDLVDGLRIDPAELQSAADILERYALDLDKELKARQAYMEQGTDRFFDIWTNWDEEKFKKIFQEMNEFSDKIIAVNRRYASLIKDALPPSRQEEFDLKVKMATYPRVYKATYTHRVLDAAEAIPELDPGQKEALKGLRESFSRDLGVLNDRWAVLVAEQDQKMAQEPNPWGWWGGGEDERITAVRHQRKELEKKTVESVKALLTPEQRPKLPDRKWKPEFDLDAPSPPKR